MTEKFTVTARGQLAQDLLAVFGTDTVPIDPPIPQVIELPQGGRTGVFVVDWDELTPGQQALAVKHFTEKQGLSVREVETGFKTGFVVPAEHCVMRRVTRHQVDLIRDSYKEYYVPKYPQAGNAEYEVYVVSKQIIDFLLGYDWAQRNVADELGSSSKRVEYFRLGLASEQERFEHTDRIIDLADSLFLLQDSEGFNVMVESLREVSPMKPDVILMDKIAELTVAKLVVKSGHEAAFVECTGKKGRDFDLQINLGGATNIIAETKCKRVRTADRARSLGNTLGKARRQLSREKPGVLFVQLPTIWVEDSEFAVEAKKVVRHFFRNTSRVNAIVFFWEEWIRLTAHQRVRLLRFRLETNPSPRKPVNGLAELVRSINGVSSEAGTSLSLSFGEFSSARWSR